MTKSVSSLLRVFSFACACLGCSAGGSDSTGDAGVASPPTGSPTPPSPSPGDAAVAPADASTAPDGSAPGAADSRLFPVATGRTWTYSMTSGSTIATSTSTITGKVSVDGKDAWILSTRSMGGQAITTYLDVQGEDVYFRPSNDPRWFPQIKSPIAEGASWTYSYSGTRQQTWRKAVTTTVAAGTFTDCWRIDYVVTETSRPADVNYSVLCRGVGTVLQEMRISTGYQSRTELSSKNF